MHINHTEKIVILELEGNCWTATYPNGEISNSLFPLGIIPLPYNKDASIELVAEELSKLKNNLQILHNEIHHGSEIGGGYPLLISYPLQSINIRQPVDDRVFQWNIYATNEWWRFCK